MSTMNIGAFARRTGLSVSAIRFYGDRGLLEPAGVDPATGYRSFSSDQIDRARMIADLRRMDMPLAEIGQVLDSPNSERTVRVREHLARLENSVDRAHSIAQSLGVAPTAQEITMNQTNPAPNPVTPNPVTPKTAVVDAGSLGKAIDQVVPAAGTSADAPHLMCVLIESKDGSIRFAATDSHRLSIRDVVPTSEPSAYRAVVAAESIREWGTELGESTEVTLATDEKSVIVTGDGVELSVPVVPVAFPDYESILNPAQDREGTSVVVDKIDLIVAFESFEPGGAVLLSTSRDVVTLQRDETQLEVAATSDGPEVHVALDPNYAADALRAAVGAEAVVEIDDALSPIVFRSADDGTYTTLLMPVKLD